MLSGGLRNTCAPGCRVGNSSVGGAYVYACARRARAKKRRNDGAKKSVAKENRRALLSPSFSL